jgi:hypothetical protein
VVGWRAVQVFLLPSLLAILAQVLGLVRPIDLPGVIRWLEVLTEDLLHLLSLAVEFGTGQLAAEQVIHTVVELPNKFGLPLIEPCALEHTEDELL